MPFVSRSSLYQLWWDPLCRLAEAGRLMGEWLVALRPLVVSGWLVCSKLQVIIRAFEQRSCERGLFVLQAVCCAGLFTATGLAAVLCLVVCGLAAAATAGALFCLLTGGKVRSYAVRYQ